MEREGSPRRILLTAFEPFGPPGGPKRPENASESVLRAFQDRPAPAHESLVLPVDPRCEVALARAFQRDPEGIVATGEAGLPGAWDTNVEAFARSLSVRASRPAGPPEDAGAKVLLSPFALGVDLLEGMEREDRIGSFWCNRAYWRVLQWCHRFRRPAVFLHLRVEGDRARQLRHLEHVVARMAEAVAGSPRIAPGVRV